MSAAIVAPGVFAQSCPVGNTSIVANNSIAVASTSWNKSVAINQFDTTLGTLNSVILQISGTAAGRARGWYRGATGVDTITLTLSASVDFTLPDGVSHLVAIPASTNVFNNVTPVPTGFGTTLADTNNLATPPSGTDVQTTTLTGSAVNPFKGISTISFAATATGTSAVSDTQGAVAGLFTTTAAAAVQATYCYSPPVLSIAKTDSGNFAQGLTGGTYTITVRNTGTSPTSGTVTVVDDPSLAPGFTVTALAGPVGGGWTCVLGTLTCTRSDVLAAGSSYPAITVTGNISASATGAQTNKATVSGGGTAAPVSITDSPTVTAVPPVLSITKTDSGNFAQGLTGGTYTITVRNTGTNPTSGTVTVVDDPTLAPGFTVTALAGPVGGGWTCVLGTLTCTRSDVLAAGSSYPAITVTGNISAGATGAQTNKATVSGGGTAGPVSITDSPTVTAVPPVLSIAKTHSGNFSQGQNGATFTITVRNTGTNPTSGTVTVVDDPALAPGFTVTSIAGPVGGGWTCVLGTLTCTRSDVLTAGSAYPVITVTGNVSASAAASESNKATVSGGGTVGPVSSTDNFTVNAIIPPLRRRTLT